MKRFLLMATVASVAFALPAVGQTPIPGYKMGDASIKRSPVTLEDFDKLKQAVLFTEEDARQLRLAGALLVPQTEKILDVWYGFVGSHPFLVHYFTNKQTGKPEADYLNRVRARFGRWIKDTTDAQYDQAWLDYQQEIALRHHRDGKNKTDGAPSVDQINLRYITAFIVPISATIEPFLATGGQSLEAVKKMMAAWNKSVTLQAILWSYPYVKDGQF